MEINDSSLAFGYKIKRKDGEGKKKKGGDTPNWATPLGQDSAYTLLADAPKEKGGLPGINDVLRGIIRCHVPLGKIRYVRGKEKKIVLGDSENSPIVLGASFKNVYVEVKGERTRIDNQRFNLLIIQDGGEKQHSPRLQLKYPPTCVYMDEQGTEWSNGDLFEAIKTQLGISQKGCWFVSDISIVNQVDAILRVHIVDKSGERTYASSMERGGQWKKIVEDGAKPAEKRGAGPCVPGENILLYGIPGCGKSFAIKRDYCDSEYFMERVLFHPDYTYSDFVGQILPDCEDGAVTYRFSPGPFTRILKKALGEPNRNYYLVIEELNRGNAPAIFGDIFQLLDRVNEADRQCDSGREIGESLYFINNKEIAEDIYGFAECPIRLPHNLFIIATMNTSDQNVFTLDTAFKRRWRMKNVRSDLTQCTFAGDDICGTGQTWKTFLGKINEQIASLASEGLAGEDKRLGAYFADEEDMDDPERFAEKVLMYLWTDVFKNCPERVFKPGYRTLEELVDGFIKEGFGVFKPEVGLPAATPQVPPAAPAAGAPAADA